MDNEVGRLSRRAFGNAAIATPALLVAACSESDGSNPGVEVAAVDAFQPGAPIVFELEDENRCFAVQLDRPAEHGVGPDQNIVAFSSICPHMGCPIDPASADPQTGHFGPCACHQSLFDLRRDGRLVRGRGCSNLPRIELTVRGATVFAVGKARPCFGNVLTEADALTTAADIEESRA